MSKVSNADINDLIELMNDIAEGRGTMNPDPHIMSMMARGAFIIGVLAGERYATQRDQKLKEKKS